MANVLLQTKVDAQCDKLETELNLQHLWQSTFSSYSKLFVESRQFWPTQPAFGASIGSDRFEFCPDLQQLKTRVPGLSCGICLRDPTFSRVSRTQTCVTQRDRHTTTVYTVLAWHRIVNKSLSCHRETARSL